MNNERIDCFLAVFDCNTYLIPQDLRDKFNVTYSEDREKIFSDYVLGEEIILESILVEEMDMQAILDGDFA